MHKAEGIGLKEGAVKLLHKKNSQPDFTTELLNPQAMWTTILSDISLWIQGSHYLKKSALCLQVCSMECFLNIHFNIKGLFWNSIKKSIFILNFCQKKIYSLKILFTLLFRPEISRCFSISSMNKKQWPTTALMHVNKREKAHCFSLLLLFFSRLLFNFI